MSCRAESRTAFSLPGSEKMMRGDPFQQHETPEGLGRIV
jgi:hypothetical protein